MKSFWERVNKTDDCWEWSSSKDKDGYGRFKLKGKYLRAHRFSFELSFGTIKNELMVLHKCDNPSCVRPDHLFTGTAKDNSDDMISKGRAKYPWAESQLAKTHCPADHEYNAENTYSQPTSTGLGRVCKICRRARDIIRKKSARLKSRAESKP